MIFFFFFFPCNFHFVPRFQELQSFSQTGLRVAMNNMAHIDYIKYDCKHFTCCVIAAKGLRAWVTLQERFPFSDIVIYFVAIKCNFFFCASDSVDKVSAA